MRPSASPGDESVQLHDQLNDHPRDDPSAIAAGRPGRAVCRKAHGQRRLAGGVIGTAVGAYAFLDDLFLGPVIAGLAVWLPWYVAFGLAASTMTVMNVSCCDWLQRRWGSWLGGHGARLEARLARLRRGRVLRHPLGWIARESPVWFVVAAGLIGTVIVVAVARLSGGAPIGRRQIVLASLAYSVGFAATYTGIGVGLEDLLRAF